MSDDRTPGEIISDAKQALQTARFGLEDVSDGPPHRNIAGIGNVATYGRATTRILHKLKSCDVEFTEWYQSYLEEMEEDPLMNYFWELRNEVLKEGSDSIGWEIYISKFEYPKDLESHEEPENAKSFFIGDELGGLGWEVEMPDGSTDKHYIDPPSDLVESTPVLPDAPNEHLGQDISHASADELCEMYIDYLRDMVADADERFC